MRIFWSYNKENIEYTNNTIGTSNIVQVKILFCQKKKKVKIWFLGSYLSRGYTVESKQAYMTCNQFIVLDWPLPFGLKLFSSHGEITLCLADLVDDFNPTFVCLDAKWPHSQDGFYSPILELGCIVYYHFSSIYSFFCHFFVKHSAGDVIIYSLV